MGNGERAELARYRAAGYLGFMMEAPPSRKRKRRWVWTKLLYGLVGLFLIATAIARLWWGSYAESQLSEVVAGIRARGEPLEWAEFAPEPVPDDQNAALLYLKASYTPFFSPGASFWDPDSPYYRFVSPPGSPEEKRRMDRLQDMLWDLQTHSDFRRERREDVAEILKYCEESFALCRQARELERSDWGIDFSGDAFGAMVPPLMPARRIGRALCVAALAAHDAGDDARAVEHIRDALALARSLRTVPWVIAQHVGLAAERTSCDSLEVIAPRLDVGDSPGAVHREVLQDLITEVVDTRATEEGIVWGMMGERAMAYDASRRLTSIVANAWQAFAVDIAMGPAWELDCACLLRYNDAFVLAWRQKTVPAAQSVVRSIIGSEDEYWEEQLPGSALVVPLSRILAVSRSSWIVPHFRAIAFRRMTGVALAIRLYELDHGRRPTTLAELAPDYLPFVPDDPFVEEGVKLRYAPDAKRAILYSVSVNGLDEEGGLDLYEAASRDRWMNAWEDGDITFFLDGDRPVGECDWEEPGERKNAYRTIPVPSRVDPRGVVKLSPPIVVTSTTATLQPTSRPQPEPAR